MTARAQRSTVRVRWRYMNTRAILASAAAAAVLATSGCAYLYPGGGPVHRAPHETGPAAIVSVHDGVRFYPACGNEELEYDGVHWYIDHPELEGDNYDARQVFPPLEGGGGRGYSRGAPMVVAPGPGDDVGTLTVYSNGTAYWISDSGDLDAHLTTEVRTYNWVC